MRWNPGRSEGKRRAIEEERGKGDAASRHRPRGHLLGACGSGQRGRWPPARAGSGRRPLLASLSHPRALSPPISPTCRHHLFSSSRLLVPAVTPQRSQPWTAVAPETFRPSSTPPRPPALAPPPPPAPASTTTTPLLALTSPAVPWLPTSTRARSNHLRDPHATSLTLPHNPSPHPPASHHHHRPLPNHHSYGRNHRSHSSHHPLLRHTPLHSPPPLLTLFHAPSHPAASSPTARNTLLRVLSLPQTPRTRTAHTHSSAASSTTTRLPPRRARSRTRCRTPMRSTTCS